MAEKLAQFLLEVFKNSKVVTIVVSMFPLIELKGAIPIGVKTGNSLIESALYGYIGSTLIFIPIFFLLIPIFNLLKRIGFIKKLVLKIEGMIENKAVKLSNKLEGNKDKVKTRFLALSLLLFVAVPFPVTGVWTGTAIAVFLKMKFKDSFIPIVLGNLIAGSIVTLLTFIFKDYVDIIIYSLFIIALIMLTITIIKIAKTKTKEEGEKVNG